MEQRTRGGAHRSSILHTTSSSSAVTTDLRAAMSTAAPSLLAVSSLRNLSIAICRRQGGCAPIQPRAELCKGAMNRRRTRAGRDVARAG